MNEQPKFEFHTSAGFAALNDFRRVVLFMSYFFTALGKLSVIENAYVEEHPDDEDEQQLWVGWREHDQLLAELVITRTADSFVSYLVDLLGLIYAERPEALRSSEQERLDFILQHADMPSLIHAIIEKRLERLSYLSLQDLTKSVHEQLGFDLFTNENHFERARELIEIRNVVVHNHGIVNRVSARKYPPFQNSLGRAIPMSHQQAGDHAQFLLDQICTIDKRAAAKFKLKKYDAGAAAF